MAVPGNSRVDRYGNIHTKLGTDSPDFGFKTDWDAVRDQEAEFKAYLGTTDYAAQNKEATDFAKLQFALSLMGRGFAAMGATPKRGESALGTLGRTMIAPIAGDISTIAGPLMKQRAAAKLAERQEERQRKMAAWTAARGSAKDMRALALELLEDEPTAVAPKISDTGIFREITALSSDGVPTFGPQIETKAVFSDGKMRQFRVDSGREIKVGDTPGTYRRYEKATGTAATAKGTKSPDFKATLAGYLSNLGGQQDRLGLGKFGIKFVPVNYDPAKGLDPSQENYPFARADGQALTLAEKTKFTSQLTDGYFNALKALKGGQNLLNINKAFSEAFFDQNLEQLGLRPASAGPAPNPLAAKTEAAVTAFYKGAPVLFQQQGDVAEVLKSLPDPVRGQNFTSGVGKLRLSHLAGVPFGPETNAPPPSGEGDDVAVRATLVKGMDRGNIQQRKIAEDLGKGTSYAGKLSQSSTPRLDDQLQVVSKAIADKTAALEKRQNDPASTQAAQLFSASLDAVARIDRMSVAAELSGVQGIVKGPIIGAGIKYLGTDFTAWVKSNQEQGATRDFVAGLPVLRELFGRALVKAAEGTSARVSNQDLKGVQKTLPSLGENQGYSRAKMRELRRYLVSTIRNTATQLGNFVVPDATLEEAARLGIDLKAIQGKEGYYNPYLNNGKYAVSKGQIPELSKEYMDSLRTEGLFNYISDRKSDPRYKMIKAKPDSKGTFQPVYVKNQAGKDTNQVDYVSLSKADLTNPKFTGIVNFNKNWLRKTYSLGN